MMFLCGQQLLLEVVQYALSELIIPRVLSQLRELQIIVDILTLIDNEVPNIETFLPLFEVLCRLILEALGPYGG